MKKSSSNNKPARIVKPIAVQTHRSIENFPPRFMEHVNRSRLNHSDRVPGDRSAVLRHYECELHRDALLRAIPACGLDELAGFIGSVLADSFLSAAYFERFLDRENKPALAVTLAIQAMERAQADPYLQPKERAVAGVAAFFWQAGYYLTILEEARRKGEYLIWSQPGEEEREITVRNAAMFYALRQLRGSAPALAALLGAVFDLKGVEANSPVDINEVTRVRNAVLRAHSA